MLKSWLNINRNLIPKRNIHPSITSWAYIRRIHTYRGIFSFSAYVISLTLCIYIQRYYAHWSYVLDTILHNIGEVIKVLLSLIPVHVDPMDGLTTWTESDVAY